jgi:hypothetical protein
MRRVKLVLAFSAVLVAMLVASAGPAIADHTNRHENRQDRWEDRCDWDNRCDDRRRHHGDFFFRHDNDFFTPFFFSPFLFVEEIDIDCDGEDDDWDGWIDEGADCEVEIEFFEWWD